MALRERRITRGGSLRSFTALSGSTSGCLRVSVSSEPVMSVPAAW